MGIVAGYAWFFVYGSGEVRGVMIGEKGGFEEVH